ncbi:hypothetical protein BJV82DRAFT_514237 [Fennellomyces sp. T-0311]|nr:hypothetical protein BJV82DRAFT_514237 [Fennellomyces sp. T-0311]
MRYGTIPNVPTIALIERGYCNWSEKLQVASTLASSNNLNLSAVLLFDNTTHDSRAKYSLYTESAVTTFPPNDGIPNERNVSMMRDNDLSIQNTPSIPVYFAPKTYGDQFKQFIAGANDTGSEREFWQLSAILVPFADDDDGGGSPFSRGYLSYIIALAAIFLVGMLFLRWWRIRHHREQMEYEAQLSAHAYNMQMRMQAKPLPVDIVNSIPISKYTAETVKNTNCAICLEDYVEDTNEVRILGCGHGFCVLCIDPWLTQKSTMCPICKWDCLPPELRDQEVDPEATLPVSQSNSVPAPHVAVVIGDAAPGSSTSAIRANTPASTSETVAAASTPQSADEADKKEADTKEPDAKEAAMKESESKDDTIDDTAADTKPSATAAGNNNSVMTIINQSDTDDRRDLEHVTSTATTSDSNPRVDAAEPSKRNSSDSHHRA